MIPGGGRTAISEGQFDRIAEFVLAREPAIPETTMAMAARLLTDTLGVIAGASLLEVSGIARNHAIRFMAAGTEEDSARILFDGRRASLTGAAFAAATQTDNLDGHDGYYPTKGHIGCAVVPALFAFAERLPELSGREAVASMAIAYEVAARAGIALHGSVSDYHTSGAWNGLGVAALGCRILRLDAATLRHALGIAEYHGPRSQMMREIDHPTMLHDGSGMGAMVGIQAVLLAMDGFEGAPAISVEAQDVAPVWSDLGRLWTVEANYIKPYPICRWAHAAIDATRAVMRLTGIAADDVESMEVRTFHEASRLFDGMPQTTSQAQYSLKFAVATMLRHGHIAPGHIRGEALRDDETARLLNRISVVEAQEHNIRFPAGRWSDVTLVTKDGRRLHSGDTAARGGLEAPLDEAEFAEKFASMTLPVMKADRSQQILREGLALHKSSDPFARFADLCHGAEAG
ncbi:MAG: MmgE/PrpD family protein [Nitratireductor sp.]|nr:MmgE/PrpD family protein [Nitratireductor sp.]